MGKHEIDGVYNNSNEHIQMLPLHKYGSVHTSIFFVFVFLFLVFIFLAAKNLVE